MKLSKNPFIKLLLILLINLSFNNAIYSQDKSGVWYNVVSVPPSPNAASLGKYGEIPVDKSTGVANISVPLLDLSEGGIDVSISLSYHAGGVRVQDESSWVGLGWALNAGGVITRTMRGLPDEYTKGFLENAEKVPWANIIELGLESPGSAQVTESKLDEMAKGFIDYEPDAFYYNYGKGSGSFMFGNNKQPVNIPFDDVLIKPYFNNERLAGFVLTTPDGIVYIFGDVNTTGYTETTTVQVQGPDQTPYISSWYLQKIVNPLTQEEVTFIYTTYLYTNSINYSSSIMFESNGFGSYSNVTTNYPTQSSVTIPGARILSAIQFKNGSVNFVTSPANDGGRKLDYFLFNAQKYEFTYDYFKVNTSSTNRNELRLRLVSVKETNPDIANDKKFSFEYSPVNLPIKQSNSIDYWGFYNAKSNPVSTIPHIIYANQVFGDADRNPDSTKSCAGTLTKINYPTGGYSKFIYGNNASGRFPTIDEISIPCRTPDPIYNVTSSTNNFLCNLNYLNLDQNFKYIKFNIHAELQFSGSYDKTHDQGTVKITNDAGTVFYEKTIRYNDHIDELINLPVNADLYTITLCAKGLYTTTTCWISYNKYDPAQLLIKREFLAGGLRINQIQNYDPVSSITSYKTFDYDMSGYFGSNLPSYYTQTIDRRYDQSGHITDYSRLLLYSSPVGGLGSSANSVSYERVIEYNGTPQINSGKLTTTFLHYEDEPSGGTPYLPQISYQFLRSKVRFEDFSKFKSENNYAFVKRIEYKYEDDTNHMNFIRGFKVSRILTQSVNLPDYFNEFNFQNFTLATFNQRLAHVFTSDFNPDGSEIKTTLDYFYENPRHLNPTKTISYTSDNKTIKTIFKYPFDYVPCVNNCLSAYETKLDSCKSFYPSCANEALACTALYGTCYEQLLSNNAAAVDWYNNHLYTYWLVADPVQNSWSAFSKCLSDDGYKACLSSLNCGYMPCIVEANSTYNKCITEYYTAIRNLYQNSTDPNDKGIYLLALLNMNNTLIEKIVSVEDVETEHYKFSYNDYLASQKPVLVKAESKTAGAQLYNTAMTYDKYDDCSNVLQATPFGIGTPESYIWGYNKKYLIAEIKNATSNECDYTGFENHEAPGWTISGWSYTDLSAQIKTGKSAITGIVTGISKAFNVGLSANSHSGYKASMWVMGGTDAFLKLQIVGESSLYKVANNPNNPGVWNLVVVELPYTLFKDKISSTMQIQVSSGSTTNAYLDDLRFYPMDAQMTTYTYDPLIGITSASDVNNKANRYEYDFIGRLILVRDYLGNILNKYNYHYKP